MEHYKILLNTDKKTTPLQESLASSFSRKFLATIATKNKLEYRGSEYKRQWFEDCCSFIGPVQSPRIHREGMSYQKTVS